MQANKKLVTVIQVGERETMGWLWVQSEFTRITSGLQNFR